MITEKPETSEAAERGFELLTYANSIDSIKNGKRNG
jgi:hypothetical protein